MTRRQLFALSAACGVVAFVLATHLIAAPTNAPKTATSIVLEYVDDPAMGVRCYFAASRGAGFFVPIPDVKAFSCVRVSEAAVEMRP